MTIELDIEKGLSLDILPLDSSHFHLVLTFKFLLPNDLNYYFCND